jgi:N-acetylmuramoyl-L-alanine amidase
MLTPFKRRRRIMLPQLLTAFVAGLCVFGAIQLAPGGLAPIKAQATPVAPVLPPKPVVTLAIGEAPSPNHDERPAGTAIDAIVIHDTETPGVTEARIIANHFGNPRSQVSAHYIIGKRGEVLQCVPDERRAWHAGPSKYQGREKVNDFSIGIELVNAQTGKDPFTEAQYQALIKLTADLVSRHGIPLERITGHRHITNYPKVKRDPADNFDWNRYRLGVRLMLDTQQVKRLPAETARAGSAQTR